MAATPTYLKKRHNTWYVQIAVPRNLQELIGSRVVVRSLKTADEREANRTKHAAIAQILSEFRQATAVAPVSLDNPEAILQAALETREAIERGDLAERDAETAHEVNVEDYLERQARLHGVDAEGHARIPADAVRKIQRSYKALKGRHDLSLSHLAEVYLEEQKERLTAQTIGDKKRRLDAFLEWFGGDRECTEVTRKVAGTYVTEVIQRRTQKDADGKPIPLSAKTRGKEASDLRSFFQWLADRGRIDENPFVRMARTIKESSRAEPLLRRAWKPEELSKVLHGIEPNDPLWALTAIAAYTGMRREEVGELEVESIDGNVLKIERGKTKAANRRVPIHPAIAPLVKQLAKTSADGYLIPGLLRGGPDKKRSWYLGKRFGRAIRQLGIADSRLDFHALRGTVVSQLEEAAVPLSTIQLIVGHRRQGVTFSSYNPEGVTDKTRRAALVKVTYGKLDEFVTAAGSSVVVKASAKPRKAKD